MGLFRKKLDLYRDYSIGEAMRILAQPKFENVYTSKVLENGKVRIITIEESRKLEAEMRKRKTAREEFNAKYNCQITNNITDFNNYLVDYNDYLCRRNAEEREIG